MVSLWAFGIPGGSIVVEKEAFEGMACEIFSMEEVLIPNAFTDLMGAVT